MPDNTKDKDITDVALTEKDKLNVSMKNLTKLRRSGHEMPTRGKFKL